MAATLSQLTLVQTQMQASYQLIASIGGLSLVKVPAGRLMKAPMRLHRPLTTSRKMPASPQKRGDMRNTLDKKVRHHVPELREHQHRRDDRAAVAECTNSQLAAVQKQISTGYRVADATDDGAAYAIAQGVRSDVGALTSANQQLGNVKGPARRPRSSGLTNISNTMTSMRDVLVKLADGNVQGDQRTQYVSPVQLDAGQREDISPGRRGTAAKR